MNDTERDFARVLAHALLADQRRRWERGERPSVEQYLAAHPILVEHLDGVLNLILQEFTLRHEAGEAVTLKHYVKRFPQWGAELRRKHEQREHGRAVESGAQTCVTIGTITDAQLALAVDEDTSTVDWPDTPFLIEEATGQRWHIITRRFVVGRAPDCDMRVSEVRVSRHHYRIVLGEEQQVEIEDLGSSWGTFVNGQRVQRAELHDGDHIEAGGLAFLFRRSQ